MIELNKDNFEKDVLKSEMPVIVDFWAPWCMPCRIVSPTLEKLSKEYHNKLKFAKMNVDDNQEMSVMFDVRGIPCMIIFNKGNELDRFVGAHPESDLRKMIDSALAKI